MEKITSTGISKCSGFVASHPAQHPGRENETDERPGAEHTHGLQVAALIAP